MTKRILVLGLPGSGKTTFSQELVKRLMLKHTIAWYNADAVRKEHDDWDFSPEGRMRQVKRMRDMADSAGTDFAICDFVCPTDEYRAVFDADITIWMNTIEEGRFADTNKAFVPPTKFDYAVTKWAYNDIVLTAVIKDHSFSKKESHLRSIVKALSWRVCGTLDTIVISFFITGQIHTAIAIGGLEVITKIAWYWLHERLWQKIKWGTK
jgi:adenylylsulfate kinase